MSTKIEVTKEVTKSVKKHVAITAEQIGGLLKKAVGAPEATPLENVLNDQGQLVGYTLTWNDTPKPRAPRKPKADAPAV